MQKYLSLKMIISGLLVLVLSNCKVPYDPVLKSTDTNALVVEGYIDGSTPVSFSVSRSRMLTVGDTAQSRYELNARVTIEDDHQNAYPLTEAGRGVYNSTDILPLNAAFQYRIHIFTADGREYASDMVAFKSSPAIDTIGWNFKDGGVQVFVNTHDANNITRYYRWQYVETWEFHTLYFSDVKYLAASNTVVPRTEQVNVCWQNDNSTSILLGSSAKLAQDVINEMPLSYIENHSKKISVLYSIWVKQYALDVNGYNYWTAMKNNTEGVGSIFDPQPNQTSGNIHCITDPAEKVVGY
ncbi:MAG: DUF4249 domain-containing protein, partial [Ginsengibacter sp.]